MNRAVPVRVAAWLQNAAPIGQDVAWGVVEGIHVDFSHPQLQVGEWRALRWFDLENSGGLRFPWSDETFKSRSLAPAVLSLQAGDRLRVGRVERVRYRHPGHLTDVEHRLAYMIVERGEEILDSPSPVRFEPCPAIAPIRFPERSPKSSNARVLLTAQSREANAATIQAIDTLIAFCLLRGAPVTQDRLAELVLEYWPSHLKAPSTAKVRYHISKLRQTGRLDLQSGEFEADGGGRDRRRQNGGRVGRQLQVSR